MLEVEYDMAAYGSMIADSVRMTAYLRALQKTIRPGSVVLELGTGPGVMALLAHRLGARRIIAIEHDDVIEVARQVARANGIHDRIEFIQGRSTDVELRERADVIVSDLRGVLPLHTGHIDAIIDARERFLAPGGTLIPRRDALWAAVVTASDAYQARIECWSGHARGLDLGAAREMAVNTWWMHRVAESQALSDRRLVATLDYTTIVDTDVEFTTEFRVTRADTAHGISVWFDAELTEGEGFSNAPDAPEAVYGQAFFPLEQPVEVDVCDSVHIRIQANLVGGDYVWGWNTTVVRDRKAVAQFRQSTALGFPLTSALLERSSADFVPDLSHDGAALSHALVLMADGLTLGEIASQLSERFPTRFLRGGDSLQFVTRLAQKYSH
jgi:type I protein arginine methyltransferase